MTDDDVVAFSWRAMPSLCTCRVLPTSGVACRFNRQSLDVKWRGGFNKKGDDAYGELNVWELGRLLFKTTNRRKPRPQRCQLRFAASVFYWED